ncbi:hypothetical protein HS7_03210 [Sulfolobales archaeon HS-7]|nr:hypothetical protein HS7_03210 [Sulfolobales archaeon HS-7]
METENVIRDLAQRFVKEDPARAIAEATRTRYLFLDFLDSLRGRIKELDKLRFEILLDAIKDDVEYQDVLAEAISWEINRVDDKDALNIINIISPLPYLFRRVWCNLGENYFSRRVYLMALKMSASRYLGWGAGKGFVNYDNDGLLKTVEVDNEFAVGFGIGTGLSVELLTDEKLRKILQIRNETLHVTFASTIVLRANHIPFSTLMSLISLSNSYENFGRSFGLLLSLYYPHLKKDIKEKLDMYCRFNSGNPFLEGFTDVLLKD